MVAGARTIVAGSSSIAVAVVARTGAVGEHTVVAVAHIEVVEGHTGAVGSS